MRLGVVVLCSVLAGCVSPVMHFGGGKTRQEAQHEEYVRVTPASFAEHHEWTGAVTTAKIRVYADDAYRAQNVRWQQTFQGELDNANDVLAAMFGVKLVADYHPWSRHAPGATLSDTLEALRQVDAGTDVLTVIALTSSLSLATATFEELGVAHLGGHHIAVRGYADLQERKVFDATFTELRAEERDVLYQARRRHKITAIFLHELAHNLGVQHVDNADTLMMPSYSERSSSFDAQSHQVILAAFDERLKRRPSTTATPAVAATPAAAPAKPVQHPKMLLTIDDAGQPMMGGNAIDLDTLDELFRMASKDDPETEIVIQARTKAARGAAINLLDHAKAAGLQRFSMTQ